jgi:hypothetical protein
MRQSQMLGRWKTELRATLRHAQPPNEKARGYKPAVPDRPQTLEEELQDQEQRLAALAKRIQNEGPVPVSDRLKAQLIAKPSPSYVEGE